MRSRKQLISIVRKLDNVQTYKLCLQHMCVPARIGVFDSEKSAPQTVELNIELTVDAALCNFDDASGVPCYATLAQKVKQLLIEEHTPLCEQLAQKLATMIFSDHRITDIELEIFKPHAVAEAHAGIRALFSRGA